MEEGLNVKVGSVVLVHADTCSPSSIPLPDSFFGHVIRLFDEEEQTQCVVKSYFNGYVKPVEVVAPYNELVVAYLFWTGVRYYDDKVDVDSYGLNGTYGEIMSFSIDEKNNVNGVPTVHVCLSPTWMGNETLAIDLPLANMFPASTYSYGVFNNGDYTNHPKIRNTKDDFAMCLDCGFSTSNICGRWQGYRYWETTDRSTLICPMCENDAMMIGNPKRYGLAMYYNWHEEGFRKSGRTNPFGTIKSVSRAELEKLNQSLTRE